MEPIDPQSTINPKPNKVVSTGPPKPRRDMRFINGKAMIVEVIGDKVVKVIGEKKNPYKDIAKQSQGEQKEDKVTSPLAPLPDSGGISTLSTVQTDTKVDETPKVETRVADTNKGTIKETVPIEQNTPKEEVVKKEPVDPINTTGNQTFLSGTGSAISDILNSQSAHDLGAGLVNKSPELIGAISKDLGKDKVQQIIDNVTTKETINADNLTEQLDSKAKDLTKKIIENAKLDKKTTKEAKRMGDESQRQMDEELIAKGVDRRLKDINFKKSIDDAVKFAGESRTRLTDLHKEMGDIEEKVGTIGKSVGEMCEGVDCIKKDFKTAQERQEEFEKQVANGIQSLAEKVQKLEQPSYVCDNCGEDAIKPLSSYCPNCGNPIPNWTGEDGHPVAGWKPYWLRMKEAMAH